MAELVLQGRNAVVTGAGGGIGRAIALGLGSAGAKVVANDIGVLVDGSGGSSSPAEQTAADIRAAGGIAIANCNSISDFKSAENIINTCVKEFGRIDILVNVAGNLRDRMVWNMTEEEWDAVINVHLKGTFNTCRHAAPFMREQRSGRIINTTSGAWRGGTGHVNYCAAKGGIVSLTASLALELGKSGITANCIAPVAATRMSTSEATKAGWKKRFEQGLMTQELYDRLMATPGPEFVSPIVVYLASDASANVNGRVFHSEGGIIGLYSDPDEVRVIQKEGMWTQAELNRIVPMTLAQGIVNPAPPEPKVAK